MIKDIRPYKYKNRGHKGILTFKMPNYKIN